MKIKIRKAEVDDVHDLFAIYRTDSFKHKRSLDTYPVMEWILNAGNTFLLAEGDGKPAGFILIRISGHTAKIDFLSVKRIHAYKGIEKALLNEAEQKLAGYELKVYVPKNSNKLLDLYKKSGFKILDEVKDLFGKGRNGLSLSKEVKGITPKRVEKPEEEVKPLAKGVYKDPAKVLDENLEKLEKLLLEEEIDDELVSDIYS